MTGNFFLKTDSDTSDNQDISPRSTSNPVFAVNIAKDSNGLGLGLIDGLVGILYNWIQQNTGYTI